MQVAVILKCRNQILIFSNWRYLATGQILVDAAGGARKSANEELPLLEEEEVTGRSGGGVLQGVNCLEPMLLSIGEAPLLLQMLPLVAMLELMVVVSEKEASACCCSLMDCKECPSKSTCWRRMALMMHCTVTTSKEG